MESLEQEVLEVLKRQPEKNPDGTAWKLQIGEQSYTKAYILEAWKRDNVMRKQVIDLILSLKLHMLGRGKRE